MVTPGGALMADLLGIAHVPVPPAGPIGILFAALFNSPASLSLIYR